MTHPYFDPECPRPTTAEIKAMGMASRLRTILRHACACPAGDTSKTTDFLHRLRSYEPDALALVGLRLAQKGHAHLLRAMYTAGLHPWDPDDTIQALNIYALTSPRDAWDMACAMDRRQALINTMQAAGSDSILPLPAWIWFAQEAATHPARAFGTLTPSGFVHTGLLQGLPPLQDAHERATFGAAIETLYQALRSYTPHSITPEHPHPLSHVLPGAALTTPQVLQDRDDLFIALLAGWPVADVVQSFPTLSHGLSGVNDDNTYEQVFHTLHSAHGQMRLAADIALLPARTRHLMIAHLRTIDTLGIFDAAGRVRVLQTHPDLRRIFLPT